MHRRLLSEWIRIARETKGAVNWEEYLSYSWRHKRLLHHEVASLLDEIDAQYEAATKGK